MIRPAEARRRASTITTNSIRLSLVGAQVDWMMKISPPRTFSLICTLTSPSLKRPTAASPREVYRRLAIRCASSGVALPAKASYQAREEPQACVHWWKRFAENCAGQAKSYPGGVLKSAMQRLEQGDVVTEAQLARLTRLHSRFMCAGINASHRSNTAYMTGDSSFRHLPETRMR